MQPPRATVKSLTRAKLSGHTTSVTLSVDYDGRHATVVVPMDPSQSELEPHADAYRRSLQGLTEALRQLAASPTGIAWPSRD